MIYDKIKTERMLRVVVEVAQGAIDLAGRAGGEPSLRRPVLDAEKLMRSLAAKGDADAMYHEYLRLLQSGATVGSTLDRHHQKSFESEFYRFWAIYLERE